MADEDMIPPTFLSSTDFARVSDLEAVYVSKQQGKLLALSNGKFILVDTIGNGFIPLHAMFPAPFTCHVRCMGTIPRSLFQMVCKLSGSNPGRGTELSSELSQYIWPFDQDTISVQFRSAVPDAGHRLNAVFINSTATATATADADADVGAGAGGEYYLAACDDGTVQLLPLSECGNGGHVWTVHLFDSGFEKEVHFCQRLRRRGTVPVHNSVNVMNHNNFGGNTNHSGSQVIGTINARTDLNLLPLNTNPGLRSVHPS